MFFNQHSSSMCERGTVRPVSEHKPYSFKASGKLQFEAKQHSMLKGMAKLKQNREIYICLPCACINFCNRRSVMIYSGRPFSSGRTCIRRETSRPTYPYPLLLCAPSSSSPICRLLSHPHTPPHCRDTLDGCCARASLLPSHLPTGAPSLPSSPSVTYIITPRSPMT